MFDFPKSLCEISVALLDFFFFFKKTDLQIMKNTKGQITLSETAHLLRWQSLKSDAESDSESGTAAHFAHLVSL